MQPTRERDYPDTGHGSIDEEHRTISVLLHGVVDSVNSSVASEVAYALDAAMDAVVAHFRHEERLMASTGFVNQARHAAAHESFLADLRRFKGSLAKDGITPNFRRWAIGRMREWFRFHVVANDVALGRHLLAHEAAARAQAQAQPHA